MNWLERILLNYTTYDLSLTFSTVQLYRSKFSAPCMSPFLNHFSQRASSITSRSYHPLNKAGLYFFNLPSLLIARFSEETSLIDAKLTSSWSYSKSGAVDIFEAALVFLVFSCSRDYTMAFKISQSYIFRIFN